MLKVTFTGEYRSQKPETKGQKRWGYVVSGTPAELAAFKEQQTKYYVENETGAPLWNQIRDYGKNPQVVKTQAGKFSLVLDEMQVANERAQKYPFLANAIAADAIAKLNASTPTSTPATVAVEAGSAKL